PRPTRCARPLHAPAPQGASRLRAGADDPEQEVARGKGPGDPPPASRRAAAHLRGREAAQAVPVPGPAHRQPQFGQRASVTPNRRGAALSHSEAWLRPHPEERAYPAPAANTDLSCARLEGWGRPHASRRIAARGTLENRIVTPALRCSSA